MPEASAWTRLTQENPQHSAAYVQRFRTLAAEGVDLGGEARLVDALLPRSARVLDAGSGTGRVGGGAARGRSRGGRGGRRPGAGRRRAGRPPRADAGWWATWPSWTCRRGVTAGFDAVVCAGNVMAFVAPSTRQEVLRRLLAHVVTHGAGRRRLRCRARLPVRRVPGRRRDRGLGARTAAVDVGPAAVHRRRRLPGGAAGGRPPGAEPAASTAGGGCAGPGGPGPDPALPHLRSAPAGGSAPAGRS